LSGHRGEWVAPLSVDYRGHQVFQLPPNGQGVAVLAGLRALGRTDRPGLAEVMVAAREAMVQAGRHVADPRHTRVPAFWDTDTVYTAVVADGMAVSLISSVFHAFGSGLTAAGAVLQNRGCGFSLADGHPNAVAGGKRPFHTIIPGLLRRDGRPGGAFGLVGGPMQPPGQLQLLWRLVDQGLDTQAAIDAPRARWLGRDLLAAEDGIDQETRDDLGRAGFRVLRGPLAPSEAGAAQVVRIHGDGRLEGGADARRDGVASGW
jgi:gamma-glutamyltranspeptidase/glutathione hydrolase